MRLKEQTIGAVPLHDQRYGLATPAKGPGLAGIVVATLAGIGLNTTLLIVSYAVGNQHPYYLWLLAEWMGDWPISLLLLLLTCLAR